MPTCRMKWCRSVSMLPKPHRRATASIVVEPGRPGHHPQDPTALTGGPATTDPADATTASVAYQQILAAFTTATSAMRAKLQRLVARQVLTETEPGLFTLATTASST